MNSSPLIFEVATWWIIPIALGCAGLGVLMYWQKSYPWPKWVNGLLGILRFASLFILFLLILRTVNDSTRDEISVLPSTTNWCGSKLLAVDCERGDERANNFHAMWMLMLFS